MFFFLQIRVIWLVPLVSPPSANSAHGQAHILHSIQTNMVKISLRMGTRILPSQSPRTAQHASTPPSPVNFHSRHASPVGVAPKVRLNEQLHSQTRASARHLSHTRTAQNHPRKIAPGRLALVSDRACNQWSRIRRPYQSYRGTVLRPRVCAPRPTHTHPHTPLAPQSVVRAFVWPCGGGCDRGGGGWCTHIVHPSLSVSVRVCALVYERANNVRAFGKRAVALVVDMRQRRSFRTPPGKVLNTVYINRYTPHTSN